MKNKLIALIDVKTFVTVALITVVCIQTIRQNILLPSEFIASTVSSVITYYFTRKSISSD
ncbi:MAG: hypothetical protein ACI4PQ_06120 [Butyricicoccaceae bacterium]